jgi:hypothetical protein
MRALCMLLVLVSACVSAQEQRSAAANVEHLARSCKVDPSNAVVLWKARKPRSQFVSVADRPPGKGTLVHLWRSGTGKTFVVTERFESEASTAQQDCFSSTGDLEFSSFQLLSADNKWSYDKYRKVRAGKVTEDKGTFFYGYRNGIELNPRPEWKKLAEKFPPATDLKIEDADYSRFLKSTAKNQQPTTRNRINAASH